MKVAAFLALGLASTVAAQQVTTQTLGANDCLTQAQINNLSDTQLQQLVRYTPSKQQQALQALLELYGIYGNQEFNLNTQTGSCAARCVTGVGGVNTLSGFGTGATGCNPPFVSGGVTYTYIDGGYVASGSGQGQSAFVASDFGASCQCDVDCILRSDCCADYRQSCNIANGYGYRYQIIETIEVPVPVAQPYTVNVPQPYGVPVNNPVPNPIARARPVPVNVPVDSPVRVNVPVNVPVEVRVPRDYPVPVGVTVYINNPVPLPVGVPVNVPVQQVAAVNNPVFVEVLVDKPFQILVDTPVPVNVPFNSPVDVLVDTPVAVDTPVPVNVPVNAPYEMIVANPVPVPYGVPVERYVELPVPVPRPVPVYVNNPVPVDYIVTVVEDVAVEVNVPEIVYVDINQPVGVPVEYTILVDVDVPIEVDIPYPVINEVAVPVEIEISNPVYINVPQEIRYTVERQVYVDVNRPVEIIEYVNNPVPVEVQRAIAKISVPVYLGVHDTGRVYTGDVDGLPSSSISRTEQRVTQTDISGFNWERTTGESYFVDEMALDGILDGVRTNAPVPQGIQVEFGSADLTCLEWVAQGWARTDVNGQNCCILTTQNGDTCRLVGNQQETVTSAPTVFVPPNIDYVNRYLLNPATGKWELNPNYREVL